MHGHNRVKWNRLSADGLLLSEAMLAKLQNLILNTVCVLVVSVLSAQSQPDLTSVILNEKREKIYVDFSVFAAEATDQIRLEVYYQVYNSTLAFKPADDLFKAEYEINVAVMGKKGKKVTGETQEKTVSVASELKANSTTDFRTSQLNFTLDPGKYEVRFILKDKIANKSYAKEFATDAKKLKDKQPRLSNILFAQAAGTAEGSSDQFTKGNLTVVPSVSHSYGGEDDGRLLFYLEIYPGEEALDKVTVQTLLRLKKGEMVYRDTLTTALDLPVIRQLREISIAEFEPGEYELEVELQGRRSKKLDEEKGSFQIRWTENSLLEHNWDLMIRQIALIADSKELKALEEAKTVEERKKALMEYWASKDPFPETPRNELKMEFYRRISYANENFGYLGRAGWETDRGRVLVRYGAPDQIEDYPFSLSSYPYQEWHYYKGGRYRKFTFVDDNHDGDYRLVYPYDGLWQSPDF